MLSCVTKGKKSVVVAVVLVLVLVFGPYYTLERSHKEHALAVRTATYCMQF